jgi:hypothetical protein
MNLEAYAIGLVPKLIEQDKVKRISGNRLFSRVLDIMSKEGISLWSAVDENKSIFIDASVINENPLDTKYSSRWVGDIEFVNSQATHYTFPITYDISESEW